MYLSMLYCNCHNCIGTFAGAATQIEKANKILMPLFFVLFAVLAVRVAFLPGASEGYKFLFVRKWEALANVDTWVMAME